MPGPVAVIFLAVVFIAMALNLRVLRGTLPIPSVSVTSGGILPSASRS